MSVTVRVPVRAPIALGLKFIVITQLPRAATEPGQVLVWAKSPVVAMLLTASAVVVLVFLKVMFNPALVLPRATLPKARDVVDRVAVCPYAGPAKASTRRKVKAQRGRVDRRRSMSILLLARAEWRLNLAQGIVVRDNGEEILGLGVSLGPLTFKDSYYIRGEPKPLTRRD